MISQNIFSSLKRNHYLLRKHSARTDSNFAPKTHGQNGIFNTNTKRHMISLFFEIEKLILRSL